MLGSGKGALEPHSTMVPAISNTKNRPGTVSLKKLNYFILISGILIRLPIITLKTRESYRKHSREEED